ncbi:MAG: hypothetical protein J07HQW2_01070 [Haloquadratum walsbyi J07HQW2]|uniref:Uncharacterized protein n=1 Tax=Haloquadratum walsbyi J07HQW2 TaxID=1238425 RepID=U1MW32_9EURY|nr:MAG: hypothetical protein J07HQW2_01070 [Haloquadratum walsbyi J07HQW2]
MCSILVVIIRCIDQRKLSDCGLIPTIAQWTRECVIRILLAGGLIIAVAMSGLWTDAIQITGVLTTQPESRLIALPSDETPISANTRWSPLPQGSEFSR